MDNRKVIYYSDELNEEFSTVKIEPREVDENYKYIHKNPLWNIGSFLIHQILSIPIKVCYAKFKFRFKVVGKEKYKKYRKQGFFVYGNHTQAFGDTFFISNSLYPKRNFMIVNPENVSIKGMGNFVQTFDSTSLALQWLIDNGITTNVNGTGKIVECCKNQRKSAYGYWWKFVEK